MGERQTPRTETCSVCGRGILHGEQTRAYVTGDGQRAEVCELCKDRAIDAGWVPADRATHLPPQPASRRRAGSGMRELLQRAGVGAEGLRRRRPEADEEPREGAARGADAAPRSRERRVRAALDAFNASDHRRTVAGLSRSLGAPRVSAVPVGKHGVVRLTVAWELSWYQWQAIPEGAEVKVREHAKGSEIAQLSPHDRAWNAGAGEDGRISLSQSRSGSDAEAPE